MSGNTFLRATAILTTAAVVMCAAAQDKERPKNKGLSVYAIRAHRDKERKFKADEAIKHLERYLRATGYHRFSLIRKDAAAAEKGASLKTMLPDDLELSVKVETVGKNSLRIHMKLVKTETDEKGEEKRTVLINTKYTIREKPLVVVGVRLKEGVLVLAFCRE